MGNQIDTSIPFKKNLSRDCDYKLCYHIRELFDSNKKDNCVDFPIGLLNVQLKHTLAIAQLETRGLKGNGNQTFQHRWHACLLLLQYVC